MELIQGIDKYHHTADTIVTLGKFDGLHRGHQRLLRKVESLTTQDTYSVMVSFDFHIISLLTYEERMQRLEDHIHYLLWVPFDDVIKSMTAFMFIQEVLVNRLHAKHIVVGSDYRFGEYRSGDVQLLKQYADTYGYTVHIVDKACYQRQEISSSRIKQSLDQGRIQEANAMLGYAFPMHGVVEHGRKLARKLGFPTLNFSVPELKFVPKYGVYYAKVSFFNAIFDGLVNIGMKPTVTEERKLLVEVHVFDEDIEGYDALIGVELVEFIRPEKRFSTIEELKEQISRDTCYIREKYLYNS